MLEPEPDEVEARCFGHDAMLVARVAVFAEDRKVDPPIVGHEASAPDDDARLEDCLAAHRQSTALVVQAADATNARRGDLALGDADQRVAAATNACSHSPAQPRLDCGAGDQWPNPIEQIAAQKAPREVPCVSAGEPDFSVAPELERDLCARVSGTDDEHRAIRQIERATVLARVELLDLW